MTNTTLLQQSPYLRTQRQFPNDDLRELSNQMDHAYIDIASKVNNRSIGLFGTNFQIITGDKWYFSGNSKPQQSLRQVYTFTTAGNIKHGLNFQDVSLISPNSYGSYTDGTSWYGVIFASSVSIAGQLTFYVTIDNIVVLSGAGARPITQGYIVLEYVSIF